MDENKDFVIDTGMPVSSPVPESQPAEPQTTEPAPIVTFFPILTASTIDTFGPIYVLSPIVAALL